MIERDKAWAEYCEASADLAGIQHRATPDQWQTIENYAKLGIVLNSCIVELRDRIAALEEPPQPEPTIWSAINALADRLAALESAANPRPQAPAPAGGLVERVAGIIINGQACDHPEERTARAAILAVAEWFSGKEWHVTAHWLREEVERG
jgi:hypothetical protein